MSRDDNDSSCSSSDLSSFFDQQDQQEDKKKPIKSKSRFFQQQNLIDDSEEDVHSADGSISGDEVGITVTSMVLLDKANNLPLPFANRSRMPETEF